MLHEIILWRGSAVPERFENTDLVVILSTVCSLFQLNESCPQADPCLSKIHSVCGFSLHMPLVLQSGLPYLYFIACVLHALPTTPCLV